MVKYKYVGLIGDTKTFSDSESHLIFVVIELWHQSSISVCHEIRDEISQHTLQSNRSTRGYSSKSETGFHSMKLKFKVTSNCSSPTILPVLSSIEPVHDLLIRSAYREHIRKHFHIHFNDFYWEQSFFHLFLSVRSNTHPVESRSDYYLLNY